MNPTARKSDLTVENLPAETIIYDHKSHQAHCLSPIASAVWACCDGASSPAQIQRSAAERLGQPLTPTLVQNAVAELDKAGLLERDPHVRPRSRSAAPRMSRRLSVRVALALPLVTSILIPPAAVAQSAVRPPDPPGPPRPHRPPRPPRPPRPRR